MILLVDWGNSRIKWKVVGSLESIFRDQAEPLSCESVAELTERLEEQFTSIYIASVRSEQDNSLLRQALQSYCDDIKYAQTSAEACGVINSYANPEAMGVDRWLGVLAAAQQSKTVAIISIGSAITLDIVASNRHLGGQILPGRRLLMESLNTTGRVRPTLNEIQEPLFRLGQTTSDCVNAGINSLIEGYLTHIILNSLKEYQVEQFIFAGGGGQFWANRLNIEGAQINFRQSLNFEGLAKLYLAIK